MKIFVVGSLNMDLVVKAPFMPESGMTITGSDFMTNAGGKGGNQAVAASKLGGEVYMVGCVGEAFGEELKNTLQSYGVHTDFVETRKGVSSGIAVIVVIDGDNRIILDSGANALVSNEQIERALSYAQKGDYLLVQLEIGLPAVAFALKKAKEIGMVTLLNPAPAATLPEGVLSYADFFIPNETETRFYTDVMPQDEASVRLCAEKLRGQGVGNFIVTLGKRGSAALIGEELFSAEIFPVQAVDTTAAGDTYVGALCVRLSEGASVSEAMRFASCASALTVTKRGAQQAIPVRSEVDVRLNGGK